MRNPHVRYMCFPSVVCSGKQTEVTITPRDISRVFREEKEYELYVVGLRDDQLTYLINDVAPIAYRIVDGCMKFCFNFENEQEYSVRFKEKDKKEIRIPMYAVKEDLFSRRPLKGDFHCHTYYSDGQDGIPMTPADYREEGFDFFALTDHNRMYTSVMAKKLYEDIKLGIHIMQGEEVHTPGSSLHIVNAGGKSSVCSKYIKNPELYEAEVDEIEARLDHVPELYRRRTAMAKWACNNIKESGGMAIFAHPFWCPNKYNISKDFADILFNEKIFDALEIVGGIGDKNNNLQLLLWQEQAIKGNILPMVGSSDSHNHDFSKEHFGRRFTVVFSNSNTTEDILDAVRSGYSAAGKLTPKNDEHADFYATEFRFAAFAQFLYENYFNETWRLCNGEGILMRRYAEGEDVGEILSSLSDTVEKFYRKFYGIDPAPVINEKRLAFLDECLRLQRTEGPDTCGSNLKVYGTNIRRE